MKSVLLLWSVLLIVGSAFANETPVSLTDQSAEKIETRVLKVSESSGLEPTLVYLEAQGRVLRLDGTQSKHIEQLKAARVSGSFVRIKVRDLGQYDDVIGIDVKKMSVRLLDRLGHSAVANIASLFDDLELAVYEPSDLGSYERAEAVFYSLDRSMKKRSQCYQRAHLWSYYMWRSQGIKSQKVFMFYTDRYIRNYKFKWWFHVAPFVVADKVEYVVDRTFTNGPLEMNEWTDVFMENKAKCPNIAAYSEYEKNQYTQDCYLLKVPMYYYQPLNLEALEGGEYVDSFRSWEIDHAKRADK